jgi:tetratricopeptide (TPR) repeat protein
LAEEWIALGDRTDKGVWVASGYHERAYCRLELGELAGYLADMADYYRLALEFKSWMVTRVDRAEVMTAQLQGRFVDFERLADEWLATDPRRDADHVNIYAGWLVHLRREQGRSDELLSMIESATAENPGIAAFRAALSRCHVDVGDLDAARGQFEILAADNFGAMPRDRTWTVSLAMLTEVCAILADRARADVLYELYRPHGGHLTLVVGSDLSLGAVDRYLGMLAATMGRFDEAAAHYRIAIELEEAIESPPNLARTRLWHARTLMQRDTVGDRARAVELAEAALAAAVQLGMARVAEEARELHALLTAST